MTSYPKPNNCIIRFNFKSISIQIIPTRALSPVTPGTSPIFVLNFRIIDSGSQLFCFNEPTRLQVEMYVLFYLYSLLLILIEKGFSCEEDIVVFYVACAGRGCFCIRKSSKHSTCF